MKIFLTIVFLSALTLKLDTCYCVLLNPPPDSVSDSSKTAFRNFLDRNFEFDTSCLKQYMFCDSSANREPNTPEYCFKVEYFNKMGILERKYRFFEEECEHRILDCYQGVTATQVTNDHCTNLTASLPTSLELRFDPLNGDDYLLRELADRKKMIHREHHGDNFNTPLPLRMLTSYWKYNEFNVRNDDENHAINSAPQIIPTPLFIFILLCSYVV